MIAGVCGIPDRGILPAQSHGDRPTKEYTNERLLGASLVTMLNLALSGVRNGGRSSSTAICS